METREHRAAWNKGKLVGQKAPPTMSPLGATSSNTSFPSISELPFKNGWGKFNSHNWGLLSSY